MDFINKFYQNSVAVIGRLFSNNRRKSIDIAPLTNIYIIKIYLEIFSFFLWKSYVHRKVTSSSKLSCFT